MGNSNYSTGFLGKSMILGRWTLRESLLCNSVLVGYNCKLQSLIPRNRTVVMNHRSSYLGAKYPKP